MTTCDITIEKRDESFVKLNCERSILFTLAEYFTFQVENQWAVRKNEYWDGTISLLNRKTRLLPYGLVEYVPLIAKANGWTVRSLLENDFTGFTLGDATYYANRLKLPFPPHDHQLLAFARGIRSNRRLIRSPTASGKSLIVYLISRFLLEFHCQRGIIIVPTTALVEQMYADFGQYSSRNQWNVDANLQRIYEKYSKEITHPLVCSTWQSLKKFPDDFFAQFDFVIGDEAHGFEAKQLSRMMHAMSKARYRIGLTGTLKDLDSHIMTIEGHFGRRFEAASMKTLMHEKKLAELEIKCMLLQHAPASRLNYEAELDYLFTNANRNAYIVDLVRSLENNTLILFRYIDRHGEILKSALETAFAGKRPIFYVTGATDTLIREKIRGIVEQESNAIILASLGTFSTGINIKNLHNVIFAHIGKGKIKTLQSIGRSLRLHESKSKATLYDIVDDMRDGDYVNYTLKHFAHRAKIYRNEGLKVTFHKVEIS